MHPKKKITYAEVKFKQKSDLESGTSRNMIYRKISTPFTYALVNLGFSPSIISILNFFPPLIGFFFLSYGGYWHMILGLMFFVLFKILDCSDGEVARITNPNAMNPLHKSIEGPYFDGVGHYIYPICLYSGLGIGIFRMYGNFYFIYLGVILSILFVLEIALIDLLKVGYRKAIIERRITKYVPDKVILYNLMNKINEGRSWEKSSFISKIVGVFPFSGLIYTTEFIIIVSILLLLAEMWIGYLKINLTIFGTGISLIVLYLIAVMFVKIMSVSMFIFKLEKKRYITEVIKSMQDK